jgi:hypothetical protein
VLTVRKPLLVALWIPPPSLAEMFPGPIVVSVIVSVPPLLIPPPEIAATLPETTESEIVVTDPFPVCSPPPLPPAAAEAVPLRIVTPDIATPAVLNFTSSTRSISAPSMIVAPAPAPAIVTDPFVISRSPVAAFGAPEESVPLIPNT